MSDDYRDHMAIGGECKSEWRDHTATGPQALASSGYNNVAIGYTAKMVTPTADGFREVVPDDTPQRKYPLLRCAYCGGGVLQDALKCVHCGAPPPGMGGQP